MATLCTITGTLRDLTGAVIANTQVTFIRSGVAGQDGSTVVPRTVVVTSSGVGAVSVTLYAGNYMATTVGADSGTVAFSVAVPSTATAVLSDLIDAAPTTVTSANVAAVAVSAAASASSATSSAVSAAASASSATSSAVSATASAASAAVAVSAAQQDLSALNIPMTYTPVAVAIDRMADWSDGGFNMRVQQSSKSWYNEVTTATGPWLNEAANETAARLLSGAGTGAYYHNTTDGLFYSLNATTGQTQIFRGGKKSYPEVMGVVTEVGRVTLFDLTEPDAPMWKSWDFTGFTITSLAVTNGQIIAGTTTGVVVLDLASDDIDVALTYSTSTSPAIINNAVNDVAITVLPDAPIDPATGMPVPTIAVATDGGVSVIKDDGTVVNSSDTFSFAHVVFDGAGLFSAAGVSTWNVGFNKSPNTSGWNYRANGGYSSSGTGSLGLLPLSGEVLLTRTGTLGSTNGMSILHENPATPTKGMVNYLTTTYLSGWQVGDSRGAWLADTTAETITGAELVTNGTFTTDTAWIKGAGVSIAAGVASCNVTSTINILQQAPVFNTLKAAHSITFTISNYVSGAMRINVSGFTGPTISANGTYTVVASGITANTLYLASVTSFVGDIDDISVTVADPDRSVKNNGLQVFGSLTKAAVATSADLVAYSGFSATNYLEQPYNPDLDFGTGDFCIMGWVNQSVLGTGRIFDREGGTNNNYIVVYSAAGVLGMSLKDTLSIAISAPATSPVNVWEHATFIRSGGFLNLYVNAKTVATPVASVHNVSQNASAILGNRYSLASPFVTGSLALFRIGATAPSADQIKHIYETEKVLFQDNAACTLYGTSDAVTDMAYDEITGKLNVLTSSGLSRFNGLRRVSEQAGTFAKVASHAGTEILI